MSTREVKNILLGRCSEEVENRFQYDIGDLGLITPEIFLAIIAILVGLLASALPAERTLRMDISKTLSNE